MPAPALNQDITLWQGDTHVFTFIVDDGSGVDGALGQPVDLAGASARWWAAKAAGSTGADIFIEKSTAGATMSFTFNSQTGFWSVVVPINPPDTQNIVKGKWYHECEIILASGAVGRAAIGKFIVNQSLIPASLG